MEREQTQNKSMYDHARDFYNREITGAYEAVNRAEKPFDKVTALEHLEESRLKLAQTNRREQVMLHGADPIAEAGSGEYPIEDPAVTRHFKELGC